MSLTVAIVGRPNVGKSTLFNRLVGKRLALVDDRPGVTRDRREGEARLGSANFTLFDTAGLEDADDEALEGRMRLQTEQAVAEADVSLFLIDCRVGVTPMDNHFADWLRRSGRPVILVGNKCEGRVAEAALYEAHSLGFDDVIGISAEHGEGMVELYDALGPYLEGAKEQAEFVHKSVPQEIEGEEDTFEDYSDRPLQLAIVGRPNVGKSTLVNYLLGEERMLTGPEAGITRDSISINWEFDGRAIKMFDTAGMRRKSRVSEKLERLSVADSLRAVQFAEIVVLVLDGVLGLEKQDLTIAAQVIEEGRGLVIAINKWDIVEDRQKTIKDVRDKLGVALTQARGVPVVTLSALGGRGVGRLMPAVMEVSEQWNRRIPTGVLNRWLADKTQRHPPPVSHGRRVVLRYMTQTKSRPPTFVVFTSRPTGLPESYLRYLVNNLRDDFEMPGVPVRLYTRKGENPYAKSKN